MHALKPRALINLLILSSLMLLMYTILMRYTLSRQLFSVHDLDYYYALLNTYHSFSMATFLESFYYLSNPIITLRSLPFMAILGPSYAAYMLSSFMMNLVLLGSIYLVLEKAYDEKTALRIALMVICSPFFIGLIASPYIDLTLFLLLGLLQSLLYLAAEKAMPSRWIILVEALVLITKPTYVFVLVGLNAMGIVYSYYRNNRFKNLLIYTLLGMLIGIMAYSMSDFLLRWGAIWFQRSQRIIPPFDLGELLLLFRSSFISLFVYLTIIYSFFKKRHNMWVLFFLVFFIFNFGISLGLGILSERIKMQMYFSCIILFYMMIRRYLSDISFTALILFIVSFSAFGALSATEAYIEPLNGETYKMMSVMTDFPPGSKVFIGSSVGEESLQRCYNGELTLRYPYDQSGSEKEVVPLVTALFVSEHDDADFILCIECGGFPDKFEIVESFSYEGPYTPECIISPVKVMINRESESVKKYLQQDI
jgi:hypothetical protein